MPLRATRSKRTKNAATQCYNPRSPQKAQHPKNPNSNRSKPNCADDAPVRRAPPHATPPLPTHHKKYSIYAVGSRQGLCPFVQQGQKGPRMPPHSVKTHGHPKRHSIQRTQIPIEVNRIVLMMLLYGAPHRTPPHPSPPTIRNILSML